MSFPRSSTGRMPPEGTPSSICSRALPPPPPSMRASAPVPPPMAIAGMKRNGAMQLTAEQQHEPLARLDAVIANATASVAEACDRQVGQVRTALSHACETEVRQLRAVLAEACAGETEKLRAVLTSTCEEELRRVTASLSRSVEAVSASCQSEVERVKLALRAACELEVSAVREACRSEVEHVKQSLREACEAEVRLVRDACLSEVQRVKCDLAEACQVEVAALVSSMQHDVAVVRTEQRKQLEVAAEPYVRAVQSVHARTAQALEALQSRAGDESRRVRALEATMVTTSRRLLQMTLEVHARERALGVDARLRQGAPFLLLQVRRPEGLGSSLLRQPAQLHVHPHMLRLAPDGDALVLFELPGTRAGARGGARTLVELAGELHTQSDAHTTRLHLSELRGVVLGAPSWCARAATFDLPALQRVSDEAEACGASSPMNASPMKRAISPARLLKADPADAFSTAAPPPTWHFVTLQRRHGTPIFLCASSAAQAITWVVGLAHRVPAFSAEAAGIPSLPPPSYAQLLWRRVRLRLDTRAAQLATSAVSSAVADGGSGRGRGRGGGGGGGSASWLGVLAAMLHEMASEEASRREWVRHHLRQGDNESAARLGWEPPAAAATQPANGSSSGDDNGAFGELM